MIARVFYGCMSASAPMSECQKSWCNTWLSLDVTAHISSLVRSASFELRRIRSIRHRLSRGVTKALVSAFVLSRLDYCNFLPVSGCPQYKLKRFKTTLLALSWEFPKLTIIICPHLASLYWLPIDFTNTVKTRFSMLRLPVYWFYRSGLLDWNPECLQTNPPATLFWYCHSLSSFSVHTLAWSEIFILCCTVCLEQSPLRS